MARADLHALRGGVVRWGGEQEAWVGSGPGKAKAVQSLGASWACAWTDSRAMPSARGGLWQCPPSSTPNVQVRCASDPTCDV